MRGSLAVGIMKIIMRIRAKDPTALDDAIELTEEEPDIWEGWHTRAYAHEARGDDAAAIEALTRAMELDAREPVLFLDRGGCALKTGDYERAVADLSEGLVLCEELDWDYYREPLHFLRAEALVELGRKAEALADLAYVRDDYVFLTTQVRSKAELLALCGEGAASGSGSEVGGLEQRSVEVVTRESLRVPNGRGMLLLDDWAELSESPDEEETTLATELGAAGLAAMDAALVKHAIDRWRKAARVIAEAVEASSFPLDDENRIRLFARRLIVLADAGALEAQGNLHWPRFSEVRLPKHP
jgi:tetratricopeptide (TPR) repeat protein